MEGTVTISKDNYLHLLLTDEKLRRLECGGVDNWEWYGESLYPDDQPDMDQFESDLRKQIERM